MRARVVAGIQARTGSTRLPRKVLAELAGTPLILRVVERVRRCVLVDHVEVLTSDEASDDELAAFLEREGVAVRRGPLQDVLARYGRMLDDLDPDYVVRVTGDCPLIEPDFIDLQLGALAAFDADFARITSGVDGGFTGTLGGQSAFSARALRRAFESDDPRDREHVGSFFFKLHAEEFEYVDIEVDDAYVFPGLRLCVDEADDLELVRRVFERFGGEEFRTLDAIRWLADHPELCAINANVEESLDNQAVRELDAVARIRSVGRWP